MTVSPATPAPGFDRGPSASPAARLSDVQLAVALKARRIADQQAAGVLQLIESAAQMLPRPEAAERHVGARIDERA